MRRLLLVLAALAVSPLAAAQKAPDSYPGGVYNASAPTLADKQTSTLQFDTNGNLKVVSSGGGGGGTVTQGPQAATATGNTWFVQDPLLALAQGSTTSGLFGPMVQASVVTSPPTYTNGQIGPLTINGTGALRIVQQSGNTAASPILMGTAATVSTIGGIGAVGLFLSTPPVLTNGQGIGLQQDAGGNLLVGSRPLTPVVSTSAEATHVLKGTPGNLLTAHASNLSVTPGLLVIINATTAPADGALTGVLACRNLPANGEADIALGVPTVASTGITAILTSATSCFTKTTGVITGFISGSVQ